MASVRLIFNYGNSNSRFPLFLPVLFCLECVVFTGTTCLTFSYCFRSETCEFYVSQLVGETSRDAKSSMSRWRRRNQCCQEEAHWWKCFGSSEVIDSSESRQNYQDGEGFSDFSGYPVESRTHPRGYLSESPFRGQVHKSGTSSIRTAEH